MSSVGSVGDCGYCEPGLHTWTGRGRNNRNFTDFGRGPEPLFDGGTKLDQGSMANI